MAANPIEPQFTAEVGGRYGYQNNIHLVPYRVHRVETCNKRNNT